MWKLAVVLAVCLACLQGTQAASPLLTTKAQDGQPTIIVDANGTEVRFHGVGWYGLNLAYAAPENLTKGVDALSQDFKTIVWRQKQLGLNSIRLAFTFDDQFGIRSPIVNYTRKCSSPSDNNFSLTPNATTYTNYQIPSGWEPTSSPPALNNGVCNSDMPNNSTYERFIWMINYYISQGFYVNLDFHSNAQQDTLVKRNESFADQGAWIKNWATLLTDILKTPANKGKIMVDLINEPDGFNLTWEGNGTTNSSLASYYLNTIDALYPICPDCLWLLEGGGQYHWCGINWGNGFMTDQQTIKTFGSAYNISDPTTFFNQMMQKPWLNQVVLAPHMYCPGVSNATMCYSGQELYDGLDKAYGYLTVAPGWCSSGKCRVFPAILDEFGSTFGNEPEMKCMKSIETYANPSTTTTHAPLTSWFYWAWQPTSQGTGGLLLDDWRSFDWQKLGTLTGGTNAFPTGFGLKPWFLTQGWSSLTSRQQQVTATAG